jgi:hypothetical protein
MEPPKDHQSQGWLSNSQVSEERLIILFYFVKILVE